MGIVGISAQMSMLPVLPFGILVPELLISTILSFSFMILFNPFWVIVKRNKNNVCDNPTQKRLFCIDTAKNDSKIELKSTVYFIGLYNTYYSLGENLFIAADNNGMWRE